VGNADDVRAADQARAAAYHEWLLDAGVYKITPKGYVSLAHDQNAIDELEEATRWALLRSRGA
jgi:glutamate-1-semialdehyde aminotransferase